MDSPWEEDSDDSEGLGDMSWTKIDREDRRNDWVTVSKPQDTELVNTKRAREIDEKTASNEPPKKIKKNKKSSDLKKLQKPATVEELNRLRETENLFHSNLFRRQIEEMLSELEIKNKLKVRVNTWFDAFKSWIDKMENSSESHDLLNFDWVKEMQLIVPLAVKNFGTKGNYRFKKPTDIKIVGAFSLKTWLKGDHVDVNVTMPSQFFDKEDYLNGRYYVKRALYLCQLAKHISLKSDLVGEVKFSLDDGDNWRPILELTPAGKLSGIRVLVHLVAEQSSFKCQRFSPLRNNVRSKWLFNQKHELIDENCPTPEYNAGILRDLRSETNEEYLKNFIGSSDQLKNAIILLKVWARQRDLTAFLSDNLIPFLVAYLTLIRKVNSTMSSYQIIRAVWNYLGTSNWKEEGITMCQSSEANQPSLSDFHSQFPLVFVDPSGFLNLCGGMCATMYQRCQDEAAKSVKSLDTPDINCFQVLFMVPVPYSRLCDQAVVFNNWATLERIVEGYSPPETKMKTCNVTYPQARDLIVSLLEKALGTRAHRIFVGPTSRKTWALDKKPKIASSLHVGIILNTENCFNLVNRGPEADSKEAEDFRSFWKDRSELRRFKDGSITESVMWSGKNWSEKRMISRQITNFIMKTHFNLSPTDFLYLGDELEAWLPTEREDQESNIHADYDKLTKDLRGLDDLPLNVISTQGASSVFRWSEIFPPAVPSVLKSKKQGKTGNCLLADPSGHTMPPWCPPALVILQLGSSNKWPKELEAVRRVRAAFNLKIAELLTKCGYLTHPNLDWVDVLTESCVFRLRIVYPGEIGLMKKKLSPDGIIMYRDTKESLQLEKVAVHLPNLTSALNGLNSQHNSYGLACCLAKRWVRSHLFQEEHISDEAIDLLVAATYVNPEPWTPPNQPQTSFLRFLALLAFTDWNIECIILNFNHVLNQDEKREIEVYVTKNKATLPCMFIATPDDREKSVWTMDGPCAVVLHRIAALANRTLTLLTSHFNAPQNDFSATSLLQPATGVFDVLINLKMSAVPRRHESLSAEKTTQKGPSGSKCTDVIPVTDFDPTRCYLQELQEAYGELCMFFYDPYGGSTIGVLWKPDSKQPKPFKVTHLQNRAWEHESNTLLLNEFAILQGFQVIGAGLVKTIQYNFGLETSVLTKLEEWKNIRQEEVQKFEERANRWHTVEDEIEKLNKLTLDSTSKSSCSDVTSNVMPTINGVHSTILQPTNAPERPPNTNTQTKPNNFKISDFETDNSSPFDNMELKTINDMEALASVLSNSQPSSVPQVTNDTYQPKMNGSWNSWNAYPTYSSQQQYYAPSHYGSPPVYTPMYPMENHTPQTWSQTAFVAPSYSNPVTGAHSAYSTALPYSHMPAQMKTHATGVNTTQPFKSSSKSVPDLALELEKEMKEYKMTYESKRQTKTPPPRASVASVGLENWQPWPDLESPHHSADDVITANVSPLARNISEMGFPLERVLRSLDKFSYDDKKAIEFLLQVQRLEEKKFKADLVERALHINNYDEKETEKHLGAVRVLLDLGFDIDSAEKALVESKNDRDAALELLIS